MDYKDIIKRVLKENNPRELIKLIEEYSLQDDAEVKRHFEEIDNKDTMEYNFYNRKNK